MISLLLASLATHSTAVASDRLIVLATMSHLGSVVEYIGGERVEVRLLVPPGADPHHYEPPEEELVKAANEASLVVMTGPMHLVVEERIALLAAEGYLKVKILNIANYSRYGLELLRDPKTGRENPHGYVFSLRGLRAIAEAVAAALKLLDGANAVYYDARLSAFLNQLDAVEEAIGDAGVSGVRVVLLTPVLQYVADEIGLEVVDVVLAEASVEPAETEIEALLNKVRGGLVDAVFLTDLEAERLGKLVDVLESEGIPCVVVPAFKLASTPHVIPLVTASLLAAKAAPTPEQRNLPDALMAASLAANVIIAVIAALLFFKVKRGEGGSS